jgi:hypothetical protein
MTANRATILTALVAFIALLTLVYPASAQNPFERLIMPGPLIKGHEKLEADCANCHKLLSKEAQDQLCLDCHKAVAADKASSRGYHGKSKEVAANACRHCHADHKGRDADIVRIDRQLFDHSATNFALVGRHAGTSCDGCHAAGKPFRAAPKLCKDCHEKESPHRGQTSDKCESCHNEKGWRQIKFDHETTKFPLTGSHIEVGCKNCHAGERYKDTPKACVECHKEQDAHKGQRGAKCESCHSTKAWSDVSFNHDTDTKFPLRGKHVQKECGDCHKSDPRQVKLSTQCVSCHAKDDAHKGQNGKECQTCHQESDKGWKSGVVFDHGLTKFPLLGKHASAKCEQCHQNADHKQVAKTCVGCHQAGDVHAGRLGADCARCHNPGGWKRWQFNHAKQARFELTGQHATANCHSCHKQKNVTKIALPRDCYGCHKEQDSHAGAFGRDCSKCHTTKTFGTAFIRR